VQIPKLSRSETDQQLKKKASLAFGSGQSGSNSRSLFRSPTKSPRSRSQSTPSVEAFITTAERSVENDGAYKDLKQNVSGELHQSTQYNARKSGHTGKAFRYKRTQSEMRALGRDLDSRELSTRSSVLSSELSSTTSIAATLPEVGPFSIIRTPAKAFSPIDDFAYPELFFCLPNGLRIHYVDVKPTKVIPGMFLFLIASGFCPYIL
jgi:hypothetical protein